MDNENNEQSRITLSIAFIATYLTVIFGFFKNVSVLEFGLNFWNDIIFGIFVVWGMLIALVFFLYLVFTALKIDFQETKWVPFLPELNTIKINTARRRLYNFGVSIIFISFAFPIYYLIFRIYQAYSVWIAFTLYSVLAFLISAFLFKVFDSKK